MNRRIFSWDIWGRLKISCSANQDCLSWRGKILTATCSPPRCPFHTAPNLPRALISSSCTGLKRLRLSITEYTMSLKDCKPHNFCFKYLIHSRIVKIFPRFDPLFLEKEARWGFRGGSDEKMKKMCVETRHDKLSDSPMDYGRSRRRNRTILTLWQGTKLTTLPLLVYICSS